MHNTVSVPAMAAAARPVGRPANPDEGLIIDLFAGGGGASEGVLRATGRHPDIAVNHDAEAIALHTANHPNTLHLQDDIRKVDIPAVLASFGNRFVDCLWASPDCRDHSKAKGGKPKDKNIRGLAWEVLRWAAAIKRATGRLPSVIALENVEEFQDWGPVHRYGKRAGTVMKKRRKETFNLWKQALHDLGFPHISVRQLRAANHGAPTTRNRLFVVAISDGREVAWPLATHAPRSAATRDLFDSHLQVWRSAASIIDWTIPCPSIFNRKRELAPKTRSRVAKGIKRYVIDSASPFIIPVTHSTAGARAYDIDDPLRTATTSKGGDFQVIAPTVLPVNHGGGPDRVYDPQDPTRTITAAPRGEQAVASAFMTPRYGERDGQAPRTRDIQEPAATVVPKGNGGDLTAVYLGRQFGTTESGRDMLEPHPTVMTDGGGGKSQVVAAHLSRQFGKSVGSDEADPVGTITAGGGGKTHQVAAFMAQHNGDRVGRAADEPLTTMVHRGTQQQIVGASIDKYYGTGVASDIQDPTDVVTTTDRFSLIAPFMEQANTGMVGHDIRKPVSTIVSGGAADSGWGTTQRLIEPRLGMVSNQYGSNTNGGRGDPEDPMKTLVTANHHAVVELALEAMGAPAGSSRRAVLEFLWEHFGQPTAEDWADPTGTAEARLRFGLVILDGVTWQIVDIGMRMLTPRELFRAQGFGDDYIIDIEFNGKKLTKTAQTRMAGNSVCPDVAAAVLRANLPKRNLMAMAA